MTFESLGVDNLLNTIEPSSNPLEVPSSEITSGEMTGDLFITKGFIRSKDYVDGSAGWTINDDGTAQFSDLTLIGGTISFGKTSFTDTVNAGYILDTNGIYMGAAGDSTYIKYDISAATLTLKGAITGSTMTSSVITGGTLQTSVSGVRTVITGNDITLYDASVGGGGTITGDTAKIIFDRTDGYNGTFNIQKRETTVSVLGNAIEMFYEDVDAGGARNYIFLGREGTAPTSYTDYRNHVLVGSARDLIQFGSGAQNNNKSGFTTAPGPEFQIVEANWGTPSFDTEGSKVFIGAVETTSQARYNPAGGGGACVQLGVQQDLGYYMRLTVDNTGIWTWGNVIPETSNADYLGDSTHLYARMYTTDVRLGSSSRILSDNAGTLYFDGSPISSASGETNTASSVGGTYGWYYDKSGVDLRFKGFAVGTGLSVTNNTTYYTLNHAVGSGHNHIPTGGTTYYSLRNSTSGVASWSRALYVGASTMYFDSTGSDIACSTHLKPSSDGAYDLGTSTLGWRRIYIGNGGEHIDEVSGFLATNVGMVISGNTSVVGTFSATSTVYFTGGPVTLSASTTSPSSAGQIRNYASGAVDQFRGVPGDGSWTGSFDMTAI